MFGACGADRDRLFDPLTLFTTQLARVPDSPIKPEKKQQSGSPSTGTITRFRHVPASSADPPHRTEVCSTGGGGFIEKWSQPSWDDVGIPVGLEFREVVGSTTWSPSGVSVGADLDDAGGLLHRGGQGRGCRRGADGVEAVGLLRYVQTHKRLDMLRCVARDRNELWRKIPKGYEETFEPAGKGFKIQSPGHA